MNKKAFKVIGFAGLLVGFIGSLISEFANDKNQEILIEDKINEVLANKNEKAV